MQEGQRQLHGSILIGLWHQFGQTPASDNLHDKENLIQTNTHVGDGGCIHAGQDRNCTDNKEDQKEDNRSTALVFLGTDLRQPAFFGRQLQTTGNP